MKSHRSISRPSILLLGLALSFCATSLRAQCLGIMPVYDASGESVGQEFTEQSTLMLLQEMQARSAKATLLNPGGVYLTTDTDLVAAFADQSKCPLVLVTSLLPVESSGHGDYFLSMSASLFNTTGGKTLDLGNSRVKIKPGELTVETFHAHYWGTTGSRPFTKQPAGRHAHALVTQVVNAVLQNPAASAAKNGGPYLTQGSTAVCPGTFRVNFPRAGHMSKSYDLLLDGSEESLKVEDGIASLKIAPGEHLILLHIADPPYKVPTQHQYAFNFSQNCNQPNLTAVLDVGGGIQLKTD